jgi:type IV pilus assembly protein PilY1
MTNSTNLTDALLGITGYPEIVAGTPYRETLIKWAGGEDALSQFGTANTYDDMRPQMGDPLHAEPALVQYGGDIKNPDLVAYVATNDGYLHAFDTKDGTEIFSFVPQELLPNLSTAMEDLGGNKLYGLDGSVTAWINDVDKDGTIDVGKDHVYIYVSMRRGGRNIYALDVTERSSPKLLWVIKGGTGDYEELGDTWSTVNVEKVKHNGSEKTVLIFGGGYDKAQDSASVRTEDSVGRAVYIADAESGERLWSAGGDEVDGTDLTIDDMDYSIPARVTPLDVRGDGYIDRLYVVDVGGQVFRFDIDNTNGSALSASITGSRIADLAGDGVTNARRFYYRPDVALADADDGKYHALALSSGFRAHPLNTAVHDRMYMLKDRQTELTKTYTTNITEAKLHDATDNLAGGDGGVGAAGDAVRSTELAKIQGAEGWYVDLEDENNPGTWIGEKGLAEPLILEGQVIFTTYTPNVFAATNSCEPNIGLGKVYFMDILDATPTFPANLDERPQRHVQLARGGIPPTPNVIITKGGEPTLCIGTECGAADLALGVRKTYWYEVEQ